VPDRPDKLKPILARFGEGWAAEIECGPGWHDIIIELDQAIAKILPDYKVHQIKSKFAELRFYIDFLEVDYEKEKEVDALILATEKKSRSTCERCGRPGEQVSVNHWLYALCNMCKTFMTLRGRAD